MGYYSASLGERIRYNPSIGDRRKSRLCGLSKSALTMDPVHDLSIRVYHVLIIGCTDGHPEATPDPLAQLVFQLQELVCDPINDADFTLSRAEFHCAPEPRDKIERIVQVLGLYQNVGIQHID